MAFRNRFGRLLYPRGTQPEVLSDAQAGPRNPTEGLCQAAQGFGLFRKTLTGNGRQPNSRKPDAAPFAAGTTHAGIGIASQRVSTPSGLYPRPPAIAETANGRRTKCARPAGVDARLHSA